jgi:hypothetical protein
MVTSDTQGGSNVSIKEEVAVHPIRSVALHWHKSADCLKILGEMEHLIPDSIET